VQDRLYCHRQAGAGAATQLKESHVELPSYRDLPVAPDGGRSAWGLFGPDDNVGLLNLQTPARIAESARLIRTGKCFALNAGIDAFRPTVTPARGTPRHHVLHPPRSLTVDDVWDNFYPQASSQWDSLGHGGYTSESFYNGASREDVVAGRRNTIEHWGRRGIAGRAVLLDMGRTFAELNRPYDPGTSTAFTVEDVEDARQRSGVEFREGDVLLLHTGFAGWYLSQRPADRAKVASDIRTPGLAHGEEMCEYLWDAHVSAVASDTFAVEAFPPDRQTPTGFLHRMLIGQFGMALGELWWTEDLAADCEDDGVYEMFLTAAPLNAPGGLGSPANALAFK
jgi:kynurenine formamidase